MAGRGPNGPNSPHYKIDADLELAHKPGRAGSVSDGETNPSLTLPARRINDVRRKWRNVG
jgi:hypothetical protein